MNKETKLTTLLAEKNTEKLLRNVHELNPRLLVSLLNKDEKQFDRLVTKVARAMKRNRKLVAKIREEK
jgi:hypothetical protein